MKNSAANFLKHDIHTTLTTISRISGFSTQTISNYYKSDRQKFCVILAGSHSFLTVDDINTRLEKWESRFAKGSDVVGFVYSA